MNKENTFIGQHVTMNYSDEVYTIIAYRGKGIIIKAGYDSPWNLAWASAPTRKVKAKEIRPYTGLTFL